MNIKQVYKLFGCRLIEYADVVFASWEYSEDAIREAEALAREAGAGRFAYAPSNQRAFRRIIERARPHAVIALDDASLKAFGEPEFVWDGVSYYSLLGGFIAVLPLSAGREWVVRTLKKLLKMRKGVLTRRVALLYAIANREEAKGA